MKLVSWIFSLFVLTIFCFNSASARSVTIVYPRHQIWVDTSRLVFTIKEGKTDGLISISLQLIEADDFESLFWGICNYNKKIMSTSKMMNIFMEKFDNPNNTKIDIKGLFEKDMNLSKLSCDKKTYYNR